MKQKKNNKKNSSSSSASESFSSNTTEGTPTITSSLKARGMPTYYEEFFLDSPSSASSSSQSLSSYASIEKSRMGAGCDRRSKSPEDLLLSLKEKKSYKSTSDEEICCKHGRLCVIGRRDAAAAAAAASPIAEKVSYKEVSQYETVKISKLENPPASFTRRRRLTSSKKKDNDLMKEDEEEKVVYRCEFPSDLSSIASISSLNVNDYDNNNSTSNRQDSTDGVYENIDKPQKTIASSPINSARSGGGRVSSSSYAIRRRRNKSKRTSTSIEELYLGAMVKRDAEKRVKKNTHFGLYHRIPSNAAKNIEALKDHIYLYIVYKSSKGDHHHYPIQRCRGTPSFMKTGKQYYLDCEEHDRVVFNSLDALINYYSVYVCVDIKDDHAEVFPIPTKYKNRDRNRFVTLEEDDDTVAAALASESKKKREKRKKSSKNQIYY
uniref:SH2 domain-containing protein n=1 Tax=Panagrolaimus sp. ES5 TaxID=591445 RepID=A0AC34FWQ9_9BILA